MTDAISTALSGLKAQSQRLAATASNIANVSTGGAVPDSDAPASAPSVYRPLTTTFVTDGSGVRADVHEAENGISIVYDPDSAFADSAGNVAVPNIDLAQEAVNAIESKLAYKANLSVIKTQDEMSDELLDIVT